MIQSLLDDTYNQFITDVANHRKKSLAAEKEWADGKIFTGRQAQQIGLVDTIGGHAQVVDAIKQKAMIEHDIRWIHQPTKTGLLASLGAEKESDDSTMWQTTYMKSVLF